MNGIVTNMEYIKLEYDDLMLGKDAKRRKYKTIKIPNPPISWGQRKLLMSEIEFFNIYWDPIKIPEPLCVYAGAASGEHIILLSEMFPSFNFHLYDPRRDAFNIGETDKIKIIPTYFTLEDVKKYKTEDKHNIFFISDIRTSDFNKTYKIIYDKYNVTYDKNNRIINSQGHDEKKLKKEVDLITEREIFDDMLLQQQWVIELNPEHALLKFRLPYFYGYSEMELNKNYLKGIVYWQTWEKPTSTETRLKPIRNSSTQQYEEGQWNTLEYEEWCYHHNIEVRVNTLYKNIFTDKDEPINDELINNYDCMCEATILKMYCEKFCNNNNNKEEIVKVLSNKITEFLNSGGKNKKGIKVTLKNLRDSGLSSRSEFVKTKLYPVTTNIITDIDVLNDNGYNDIVNLNTVNINEQHRFKLC